jgi:hypothetical protein
MQKFSIFEVLNACAIGLVGVLAVGILCTALPRLIRGTPTNPSGLAPEVAGSLIAGTPLTLAGGALIRRGRGRARDI